MLGIVLAAGRGRRMGGPKALLQMPNGLPLAWEHARLRSDCTTLLVVVRDDVATVLEKHRPPAIAAALVVSAQEDALGPAGSLRAAALAHPIADDDLVLVTPVDCMPVSLATVAKLHQAMPGHLAVKPRFGGRGGHPVLLRGALLQRYRKATPPLREVLRSLAPKQLCEVPVDDPAVACDVDTASDLGATPIFVR